MAAITSSTVTRHSLGDLTLLIVPLTLGSTSDTYVISTNTAVVDYWMQTHVGSATTQPDVTWTASTGTFLMTSTSSYGASTLFILVNA